MESKEMKKVFCVGLVVSDVPLGFVPKTIFQQDRCRIEPPVYGVGGDAANVAVVLAKLGIGASFCGLVGKDFFGELVMKRLAESGVDISGIVVHPDIGTAVSYILIDPEGERHFLVSGGLNEELSFSHISERLIREADVVYLGSAMNLRGMDQGGTAELFKKAHALGKTTVADFGGDDEDRGNYWIKLLEPMLRETDVAIPSYREAVLLTGKKELGGIRKALSPYGLKILVVKLGAEGCYITDFKKEWRIPAFPEFKPVDTTGAGDCFAGGFIRGLLSGWSPENSGFFANAVAGFNITKLGATGGVPDFETAYRYVNGHPAGGPERFPAIQDLG
jgi:ribokinase